MGVKYPAVVEPKYDGEVNMWDGKRLTNRYGKQRWDFPAINNLPNEQLLGELYYSDGKRGSFYQFLEHKEDDTLNFVVFDIVANLPLNARKQRLDALNLHNLIESRVVYSQIGALQTAQIYIKEGFEGVVVKSLDSPYPKGSCSWVKIKDKDKNWLEICYIDPVRERIEVKHPIPDSFNTISVGIKCLNKYKSKLKVGDIVEIEHYGVLPSGSLRHPTFKGGVICRTS